MQQLGHNRDTKKLLLLIAITAGLRLWGISYGLPAVYNSTEYFLAKHALSLGARHTLEPLFFIYPTLYVYFLAALFGGLFAGQFLLGITHSPADFAVQFLINPTAFYLAGRGANAVFLVLATVMLYRALRFWMDEQKALILALLYAGGPTLHYLGFWMIPDPLLQLGVVTVLYYMAKAAKVGLSLREWRFAALVCGLTISVKYNAGFLAFGWLATVYLFADKPKLKKLLFAVLFILLGFLIGTPYWVLEFGKFWEGFRMIWSQSRYAFIATHWPPYLWEITEILKVEGVAGVFLLFAMVASLLRYRKENLPFILIIWPTFLLVGSWDKKGLDYLWCIYPLLILILAKKLAGRQPGRRSRMVWTVLIVGLVFNLLRAGHQDLLRSRPDTRELASEWIVRHVPPQSAICYDHYHYDLNIIDLRRFTEYGVGSRLLPAEVKKKLLEFERLPNVYRMVSPQKQLQMTDLPDSLKSLARKDPYLLEQLTHPHKSLAEIKAEGAVALILNSETFRQFDREPAQLQGHPLKSVIRKKYQFYREIFREMKPAVTFQPSFWQAGPEIRIYLLR